MELAHAGPHRDRDRGRARGEHDPWQPGEAGATREHSDDRDRQHDDALDLVGERLGVLFARQKSLRFFGRGHALVGEEHAVDGRVDEVADSSDKRNEAFRVAEVAPARAEAARARKRGGPVGC